MTKICSGCKEDKPTSSFHIRDGEHTAKCRQCKNILQKAWNTRNPSKQAEYMRRWKDAHPEKDKADRHKYMLDNRITLYAKSAEWARTNPAKARAKTNRRRCKEITNGPGFTAEEWIALKTYHGNMCLCCESPETFSPLHADHVIPISSGGYNGIENIQPLCQSCNSRKGVRSTDYRSSHLLGRAA